MQIEEDIDKTEEKLSKTMQNFKDASHLADENERLFKKNKMIKFVNYLYNQKQKIEDVSLWNTDISKIYCV
jgi:hypothetical protein